MACECLKNNSLKKIKYLKKGKKKNNSLIIKRRPWEIKHLQN